MNLHILVKTPIYILINSIYYLHDNSIFYNKYIFLIFYKPLNILSSTNLFQTTLSAIVFLFKKNYSNNSDCFINVFNFLQSLINFLLLFIRKLKNAISVFVF